MKRSMFGALHRAEAILALLVGLSSDTCAQFVQFSDYAKGLLVDTVYRDCPWVVREISSLQSLVVGRMETADRAKFLHSAVKLGRTRSVDGFGAPVTLPMIWHSATHVLLVDCLLGDEPLEVKQAAYRYLVGFGREDLLKADTKRILLGLDAYRRAYYLACQELSPRHCGTVLRAGSLSSLAFEVEGDRLMARLDLSIQQRTDLLRRMSESTQDGLALRARLGDTLAEGKIVQFYRSAMDYRSIEEASRLLAMAGTDQCMMELFRSLHSRVTRTGTNPSYGTSVRYPILLAICARYPTLQAIHAVAGLTVVKWEQLDGGAIEARRILAEVVSWGREHLAVSPVGSPPEPEDIVFWRSSGKMSVQLGYTPRSDPEE